MFTWAACALTTLAIGCGPQPEQQATPSAGQQPSPAAADRRTEFGRFPDRAFIRVNFDKLQWRVTEGNTLGVQTAVIEGDPSKPGFYLTINRFPPGAMSRPHYHPDERWGLVLRGTWYTGEGNEFTPEKTVGLKPGDYMRHPAGGPHFDGALDEEVFVAIGGYGATGATVIDGGELFGRSRPSQ
jgi:quercetin dioxygenase-like cupin family protein